jgi:alkylation response protein AidB-like acyl-CoA dehydrogenase
MNLTEPQAGSDLGALTMRAESDGADGWRLTGQKIFITWGDHDVADNIVHLVLARLPDAPPGSRGLTLFLAPKRLVGEDGKLGETNALRPVSLEHKLGIHASPTCVMAYEGARAEMVGAPNQGLANMFVMMNAARLQVGVQGVGLAERAYQRALAFSLERTQGRSAWTGTLPSRLFDHPDVRRTLMIVKAKIEAARAICLATAVASDVARLAGNPVDRDAARLREEILTPVAKAWSTDMAVEAASMCLQIHGGMGFIEETGAAQYYRDARVLPIYEGANGIQAIDLMGRKLALGKGAAVRELVSDIVPTAAELKSADDGWLHTIGSQLEAGLAAAQAASGWLIERRGHAQPDALAGATPYLRLLGDVVGGWMLGRQALAASKAIAAGVGDTAYWRTRIGLARVYAQQVLAQAPGHAQAVTQGAVDLFRATPESLGA